MVRLPRYLPCVALACSITLLAAGAPAAWGQPQPPATPAADAAAASPSPELLAAVDSYWHYAKIARYGLANDAGQKILAMNAQPLAVLEAFEQIAEQHNDRDRMDDRLLRFQGVDELREVTAQLTSILGQGQFARRSDPKFIDDNIRRLIVTDRGYLLGLENLRRSGELAYPQMINYLRDREKGEYHLAIRRAMRDLGRIGLNPLSAATQMKDPSALTVVATVLGELGYEAAVPYLARLAQDANAPDAARRAAQQGLQRMGAGENLVPADLFYDLAERFYYGTAAITADPRNPMAYVWFWDEAKGGLIARSVPPVIFNEVMAMRSASTTLQLNSAKGEAVSLWLASNYKREAELPADAADPTAPPDSAHFYGVSAGTRYLNEVIRRALTDRNSAVALRSIRSLEEIAGQSNLFAGGQPILDALQYGDRQVRFEAAFTLASALPQESFTASERVVPILAEAISQTGRPNVLVVAAEDKVAAIVESLKQGNYGAAGASSVEGALAQSQVMPSVDVVVFSSALTETQVMNLIRTVNQTPALLGAALVVMAPDRTTPFARYALVAQGEDATALQPVIEEARAKVGGLPMDEQSATTYAMRAADLLGRIALNRNPVFDLSAAEPALLRALDDPRPELVMASARVLASLNSRQAQSGLLGKAVEEKAAEDIRITAFKNLATNAKRHGNLLSGQEVTTLTKAVQSATNADLKAAAAEARGALNLPADEAADVILGAAGPSR